MKMKKLFLCAASFALATSMSIPAFAAEKTVVLNNDYIQNLSETVIAEGGTWYYDSYVNGNIKTAISNYQHNEKYHRSSCSIGDSNEVKSDGPYFYKDNYWQPAGKEARSSTSGNKDLGKAKVHYDTSTKVE